MENKLNLPDEFRFAEESTKSGKHPGFSKQIVGDLLTALSEARDEVEIKDEIIQELTDAINERGGRIQKLMQSSGKDWVGLYDIEDNEETYHIVDNKSGLDLQDNAIVMYIVELEAENKRLREVIHKWEYPLVGGNLIKEDIPHKDICDLFVELNDALSKDMTGEQFLDKIDAVIKESEASSKDGE